MHISRAIVLLGFVALCLGVGFLGSFATAYSLGTWYRVLAKPSWTPPGWIFGPVWTVLYILMGYAAYRVHGTGVSPISAVFIPFWCQLVLNLAWSWIFFYLREPGWALADLLVLIGFITWNFVAFIGHDLLAGILLVPYLGWSAFAVALNFFIWRMNG